MCGCVEQMELESEEKGENNSERYFESSVKLSQQTKLLVMLIELQSVRRHLSILCELSFNRQDISMRER